METISVRFEEDFVEDIEKAMKSHRYATKTEFIRESVRDKITQLEKDKALIRLEKVYGFSSRKTTSKQLHDAREKAIKDIAKKLRVALD